MVNWSESVVQVFLEKDSAQSEGKHKQDGSWGNPPPGWQVFENPHEGEDVDRTDCDQRGGAGPTSQEDGQNDDHDDRDKYRRPRRRQHSG